MLQNPLDQASVPAPGGKGRMWSDPRLQSREVLSFAALRGLSFEALLKQASQCSERKKLVRSLIEIVQLSRSTMDHMNELCPAVPTDSAEHILDLLTRPSARTVVLFGRESESSEPQVLGYGLIILEREDIPDLDDIPPALKDGKDIARAIRLFVRPEAAVYGGEESSTSAILDSYAALAPGKKILRKILVGPPSLHPVWLRAANALRIRGMEDSGFAATERVPIPGGTRELLFKWWSFPPDGEAAMRTREEYLRRFESLKVWRRQRIAPAVAHFLVNGGLYGCLCREDDAHTIAELVPGSFIFDVCSPEERQRRGRARLSNLIPKESSPFTRLVEGEQMGGFFNSSVLPDILPFGREAAMAKLEELFRIQMAQLKPGGCLVLRDTIAPDYAEPIRCRFATAPLGGDGDSPASLFERFLSLQPEDRRAQVRAIDGSSANMREYEGPADLFAHFAIIKEYRDDFDAESLRRIGALRQKDIEEVARRCGLKILSSQPTFNQWIYDHWFEGQLSFHRLTGERLPNPATSYCLVAQKAGEETGVSLSPPQGTQEVVPKFLTLEPMEREDGQRAELAKRPNQTLDSVPWFGYQGKLYVVEKKGYPRPITLAGDPPLDGSSHSGYVTEQIAQIVDTPLIVDGALTSPSNELSAQMLRERGGIWPEAIQGEFPILRRAVLPAPHLVDEVIVSEAREVEPLPDLLHPAHSFSGLHSPGTIAPMDSREVLYACQNGDLLNARIEWKVYELLQMLKMSRGPWIAGAPELSLQEARGFAVSPARQVLLQPKRADFRSAESGGGGGLEVCGGLFSEHDGQGRKLAETYLEWVRPHRESGLSTNSAVVLPVVRIGPGPRDILVGIEVLKLPAAQIHFGSSRQAALRCIEVPSSVRDLDGLKELVRNRANSLYSLIARQVFALGGKYYSSPGITPELVYPFIMEVDIESARLSPLFWVPLQELLEEHGLIVDGNLLTAVLRGGHMFEL